MKRNSSFRLLFSFAECLKTEMSLFFHFLLFYDTIDDEKKARKKSSIREYVRRDERMKKSLKIMRKQFFCVHACWESLADDERSRGKKSIFPLFSSHIRWFRSSVNHHRNLYQCLKFFFWEDVDACVWCCYQVLTRKKFSLATISEVEKKFRIFEEVHIFFFQIKDDYMKLFAIMLLCSLLSTAKL